MGSHYDDDYPPRAPFTSNVPPEDCYSYLNPPRFTFGPPYGEMRSPHLPSFSSSDPPDFTLLTKGIGLHELHDNSSSGAAKVDDYDIALAHIREYWVNCYTQPDFTRLTEGTGLHELHDNSSSGAAKADDYDIALAHIREYWVNFYTQPDFTRLTEGTGLHELHDNSSSRAAKADDDTGDEHLGGSWVNISDAGIINKPTDDGGLNKPFDGGNKPTDTLAAWNTSWEKETGAGVGAGGYHTCEELSGSGYRACGSCGNACYTCGEADHFARKCSLGADC